MSPDEKEAYRKQKAKDQLIGRMGVDPEHDWKASYEVLPGKEKVVDELKRLAESADQIYLATDLDREGEAIAWHLREVIGHTDKPYRRVVFNEITKKAIQAAFEQPSELNMNRVNAQQAVGFLLFISFFFIGRHLTGKSGLTCPFLRITFAGRAGCRQVADMSDTRLNNKVFTQVFVDGFGFGRASGIVTSSIQPAVAIQSSLRFPQLL